ncbi:protein MEI2-like 6 [Aristolochia californica]|uniref:protein MEI2-like 6 n=1 Tax=Aristolochia californica TaxID=171875 RepID=UPI0035D59061
MAALNPQALEFYPCAGVISSLPFPQPDCFYPPPLPSLLPTNALLPDPYGISCVGSPCSFTAPLSVYNSNLHVYLGFPFMEPPVKTDFRYSAFCGFPLGVEEEKLADELGRKSEATIRPNRRRRRKDELPQSDAGRERMMWVAKGRNKWAAAKESKSQPESVQLSGESTTLMIRNIPNKFTKMLLDFLDSHCREENSRGNIDNETSAYDFVYLPMDFGSGCNLGYAFVNFTSRSATVRLHRVLHKKKWEILGSKKICEITLAKIQVMIYHSPSLVISERKENAELCLNQGVEALQKHFEKSIFACESDEYLPVRFDPHRDGSFPFKLRIVGSRFRRGVLVVFRFARLPALAVVLIFSYFDRFSVRVGSDKRRQETENPVGAEA